MASKHKNFQFYGRVDGPEASEICSRFQWALLPIQPEALKYAFPSKLDLISAQAAGFKTSSNSSLGN